MKNKENQAKNAILPDFYEDFSKDFEGDIFADFQSESYILQHFQHFQVDRATIEHLTKFYALRPIGFDDALLYSISDVERAMELYKTRNIRITNDRQRQK